MTKKSRFYYVSNSVQLFSNLKFALYIEKKEPAYKCCCQQFKQTAIGSLAVLRICAINFKNLQF